MNFYGSEQGFNNYMLDRDIDVPATDIAINAALLIASEWIDSKFRSSFDGEKVGYREQVREWPRIGHLDYNDDLIPSDEVPREIEHATYEIALRHMSSPGVLSIDYTPSLYSSVSVDGAVAAKFIQFGSVSEIQAQFSKVVEILSGLLSKTELSSKLSGSSNRV